ncbi:MAG TPA: hypothetical protein VLJ58_11300 [Ramlibacter sp.]|nr:hypothetical protein [Ramlibacter sp.]
MQTQVSAAWRTDALVPVNPLVLLQRVAALQQQNAERLGVELELQPVLGCAATLAEFDAREILEAFALAADDANLRLLQAHCEDCGSASPGEGGSRPWRLSMASRRQALHNAGSLQMLRALRQRLTRVMPGTAQRMADALLLGPAPVLASLTIGELAALVEVRTWYEGVVPQLPDALELRGRLAMVQLLDPMFRLVGEHFVGRGRELSRLADYVGVLPPESVMGSAVLGLGRRFARKAWRTLLDHPPLFVAGPGGVGKSSLLARFILDHMHAWDTDAMPFVMLDFDRAQVEATLPMTLLVAALHQLRVQFPVHAQPMARMAERLVQLMRSTDGQEYGKSDSLQESLVMDFARQVDEMLGGSDNPAPLLWVLDTFEEPQRLGDSTVGPLWELMNTLQQNLPRLRLVVCGRVVPRSFHWDVVPLDEFDDDSAMSYLTRRLAQVGAGEKANPSLLARAIKVVGRTPLALRLAARLIAEEDPQLLMLKVRSERIQAVLFHRVLEHIRVHDRLDDRERVDATERVQLEAELRCLVFPGLAVRRLTPGVIEHVLAKPCGVKLRDVNHAKRLFMAMRQQVDIVEPVDDDGGEPSLLHRSDVRRMMLRDLEQKAGELTVRRIDRRAAIYHARMAGPSHRAEEIYHRLRLRQSASTIRGRWEAGLERYLNHALEEIAAPSMRVLLAELLGVTLDAAALQDAAQDEWERQAHRRVSQYLHAGNPKRALDVLRERKLRVAASPLLRLEAQALQLSGEFGLAAKLARRAVEQSVDAGDLAAACDAALLLALADEADDALESAQQQALLASEWAMQLGDDVLLLRAQTAQQRLDRKLGLSEEKLADQAHNLRALLATETLRQLRSRPALLRELLAELGSLDQRLLRLGIEVLGVDLPSFEAAVQLGATLEQWAAEADRPEVLQDIALAFGVPVDKADRPPSPNDWAVWLWTNGAAEIGSLVLSFLREAPPDGEVLARLAGIYQREVERRIVRGGRKRVV